MRYRHQWGPSSTPMPEILLRKCTIHATPNGSHITCIEQVLSSCCSYLVTTLYLMNAASKWNFTRHLQNSQPVFFFLLIGAVSIDSTVCAEMAADILRRNGSAVDAAITGMLCSGVVQPASSGIGGGGFMTVRLNNGSVYALNFRETAPLAADENIFNSNATLSVLVGTIGAHNHHGKRRPVVTAAGEQRRLVSCS